MNAEHPDCRMNDHDRGSIESGFIYCQREGCSCRVPISDVEAIDFIYGTDPEGPGAQLVAKMKGHAWCCHMDGPDRCRDVAEYQIIDQADPNPYDSFTEACEAHVGALLGHQPSLDDPINAWTVVSIDQATAPTVA